MTTELAQFDERLSELVRARPERVYAFMVDAISLVQSHLPPDLIGTLRSLQNSAGAGFEGRAPLGAEELAEARLECWKYLQACACYGSGVEMTAVRALLTLLEPPPYGFERVNELVRLVQGAEPPSGALERLLDGAA